MKKHILFNILIIVVFLSACSARENLAPLVDHNQPPSTKVLHHIVAPGETLYSIAWRYDIDYKKLARSNNISSSYRIYPGQKIDLTLRKSVPKPTSSARVIEPKKPNPPAKTHTQVSDSSAPTRLKKPEPPSKKAPAPKVVQNKLVWSWPARGDILTSFSFKGGLNKGIDIAGNLGESVLAASSGKVVYAGDGLRGYGKLIIIKHSEKYLSAYAHNQVLTVREGSEVKRGDQIAKMGKTGTDKVKLHFEIRYDGKPVNPIAYLPPRK